MRKVALTTLLLLISALIFNEMRSGGFLFPVTYSTLEFDPLLENPPLNDETAKEVETILSQKFHFLGAGRQAYAYGSEDGLYVIKFFKRLPIHFPSPLSKILSSSYQERFNHYRRQKISAELKSCKLAYDLVKEESGLLFAHLNKTKITPKELFLVDTLGFTHTTSLENKEFILQRKAQLFYSYINQKMREKDVEAVQAAIRSALQIIVTRYSKGVIDEDPAFHRNLGVIEGKAMFIDTGKVKKKRQATSPLYIKRKVRRTVQRFEVWLKRNHPELLPCLHQELAKLETNRD